ncbi:MAG: hypothetical protein WC404_00255 [Candidatus Omnitrophota bacterium]|jgi:hypothetical protein
MASVGGKMTQAIGEGVSSAAGMLEKALSLSEQTKAENILSSKIADIESRAAKDNDLSSANRLKYSEEVDMAINNSSSEISIPAEKDLFMSRAQNKAVMSRVKLDTLFNKKLIDRGKAELNTFLESKRQQYITSINMGEKEQAILERDAKLDAMADAGFLTYEEATNYKVKLNKEWNEQHVDYDVSNNPEWALQELQKGEQGFYRGISPDVRAKGASDAKAKIRKNQILFQFQDNQDKDKNEAQMLIDSIDGKLSKDQIKNSLITGGIRRPFAEKMFKQVLADPNPKTNNETYIKVRAMELNNAPVSEITQTILDNNDKLSNEDKRRLIDHAFSKADIKEKDKISYNAAALRIWSVKNLGDFTKGKDLSADVVYEFHRRVDQEKAQGNRVDEIAQEVIKDKIKEYYPSTAVMSDVPNFIAEKNSIKKIYEKNSKLKGKAPSPGPSVITGGSGIDFDDL